MIASTDWNPLVPAIVGVIVQVPTLVLVWLSRRDLKTSNGQPIGPMVEETHELAKAAKEHSEQVATELERRRRGPQGGPQ